jgi:undecaprenyl-diphosphatase
MNVIEALILGILQGLTEFLPISSSGHLVLGQELLGISVPGNEFEVVVHLGTLCSVLIVFWNDILQLLKTLKDTKTQKYILALAIGTLPAIFVGLLFKDIIGEAFENIKVVASTLFITGLILLSTKFIRLKNNDVTIGKGLLIGIAQAMAIIPGISRSGITISTGMHLNISSENAAKFSFLLAIPAIAGAGLLTGVDVIKTGTSLMGTVLTTGFLSSLVVGWLSLKWLISLIKTGKFHWLGIYCIFIGLISWII